MPESSEPQRWDSYLGERLGVRTAPLADGWLVRYMDALFFDDSHGAMLFHVKHAQRRCIIAFDGEECFT